MRVALHRLTLTGLFLALGAASAQAQHPQVRDGFWINFGFGYGSAHEKCDGCADTTIGGFTGFVRLGGTVSPHVLIGGEIIGFSHNYPADTSGPSADEVLGSVTASLYYYPKPAGGFFLKTGLGFSDFDFSVSNGGGSVTGVGAGVIFGLGYDIRVGRNVSITPVADFWYGNVGDLKSNGSLVNTGWKHSVASFGLGVTFH
jgi:outer membrane protein with beta-barrel domain